MLKIYVYYYVTAIIVTLCNTVFILIECKQKNNNINFKSGLRTIRVKTIPGSASIRCCVVNLEFME